MIDFIESFLGVSVWGVAKWVVFLALFLYFFFALVVVRQVKMMTRVVSGILDLPIKIFAWLHLLFAVLVILFALIIL